jgi:acyl dehydratase
MSQDNAPPETGFASPIDSRYFEDYIPGSVHSFGEEAVTEAEIVAFARAYDPQDFHTDPAKAAQSPFGGLIASGWLTCALMMRMYTEHYLTQNASLASPGIDELRWLAPVRPGDMLRARVTVLGTRRSATKPDRGIVQSRIEVLNQNGQTVMTLIALNLIRCRG